MRKEPQSINIVVMVWDYFAASGPALPDAVDANLSFTLSQKSYLDCGVINVYLILKHTHIRQQVNYSVTKVSLSLNSQNNIKTTCLKWP